MLKLSGNIFLSYLRLLRPFFHCFTLHTYISFPNFSVKIVKIYFSYDTLFQHATATCVIN
jgi:hypothetical protein